MLSTKSISQFATGGTLAPNAIHTSYWGCAATACGHTMHARVLTSGEASSTHVKCPLKRNLNVDHVCHYQMQQTE